MKIEDSIIPTAAEPGRPVIQRPQPPLNEPDREDKEYLEWRQELL